MTNPSVPLIRSAYEEFHRQIAKAFLVATGENREYRSGRFASFQKEIDEIVLKYGERNIFMSAGIGMLISSLEIYLKTVFLCLVKANPESKVKISAIIGKGVDPELSAENLVNNHRNKFNFQNLKYTQKNFKQVFGLDLKKVFNSKKRKRGFLHPIPETENFIKQKGVFDYLVEPNIGGLNLRHKIIHQSITPEESRAAFLLLYEILKYFSTSLVETIFNVDFDKIPKTQ